MTKDEMIQRWPLFTVREDETKGLGNLTWLLQNGSSHIAYVNKELKLTKEEIIKFDQVHQKTEIAEKFSRLYPNLFISHHGVWIKVNGLDRESLLLKDVTKITDKELKDLNEKVEIVSNEPQNYFLCGCCQEICPMKEDKEKLLSLLIDETPKFFKFRSSGASMFCTECTENDPYVKKEFDSYLRLGNSYYD